MKKRLIFLFLILSVASLMIFSACENEEGNHVHNYEEWTEIISATCEMEGQRTRKCIECEYEDTESIAAIGHDWDDGVVTTQATCEEKGERTFTCRNDESHTYSEEIEPIGHDWHDVDVIIKPTCEGEGLRSAICSRCETQDEQIIPALDHDWNLIGGQAATCYQKGEYLYACLREDCQKTKTETTEIVDHVWDDGVKVEATCEQAGSWTYSCTFGCGEKKVETIQALGHKWSNDYTIDKQPSATEEGSKSRHCTRGDCTAKTDIQSIPKLNEEIDINYKLTIVDPCGDVYRGTADIEIYLNGVMTDKVTMTAGGVTTIKLGQNNYKIRLSNLTAGYSTAQTEYDLYANSPQLTIVLKAAVIEENNTSVRYKIGSILYDYEFTYFDTNGGTKTSSYKQILENKKGILLNFYFTSCSPCRNEMPDLVAASKTYEKDIQVVMVNYYGYADTNDKIKDFMNGRASNSPLWFMNVTSSRPVYNCFSGLATAFPTTVLIDCNGQVVFSRVGSYTESGFNSIIKTYILNRYNTLNPAMATNNYTLVAIFPSRKFY